MMNPGEGVIRVTSKGITVEACDMVGGKLELGFPGNKQWHSAEDLEHLTYTLGLWLDLPRGLENHDHSHLMGERRVP